MTLPNFFLIGTAKAGTTSLYSYLEQHPEIYMSPVKEPRFFTPEIYSTYNNAVRSGGRKVPLTFKQYSQLFAGVQDETAIGEASTDYLYLAKSAARIKEKVPNAKLIVILRNPAERAFSAYCYQLRDGYETLSFEEALNVEGSRIKQGFRPGWHYQEVGFYHDRIKQYLDIFPAEQIKIYLYEELASDSIKVTREIYHFLGVDSDFIPNFTKKNISGVPKNQTLHNLFTKENFLKSAIKPLIPQQLRQTIYQKMRKNNLGDKPKLSQKTKKQLTDIYEHDVIQLQTLIQKDLSAWLV